MEFTLCLILFAVLVPLLAALLVAVAQTEKESSAEEVRRIGRETQAVIDQVSDNYLRAVYLQSRRR